VRAWVLAYVIRSGFPHLMAARDEVTWSVVLYLWVNFGGNLLLGRPPRHTLVLTNVIFRFPTMVFVHVMFKLADNMLQSFLDAAPRMFVREGHGLGVASDLHPASGGSTSR
jgi:hypothetical protein